MSDHRSSLFGDDIEPEPEKGTHHACPPSSRARPFGYGRCGAEGWPSTQFTSQGPPTVMKSSAPSPGFVQASCTMRLGI
jgi:hypothetical protein